MNDSLQPWTDPELEARLVATILGEAYDFEREEIDRRLKELPELRVLKRRLETVHGLLGEAAKQQKDSSWKLPPTRRKTILDLLAPGKSAKASSLSPAGSQGVAKRKWKVWLKYGAIAAVLTVLASLSVRVFGPMASRELAFSSHAPQTVASGSGNAILSDPFASSDLPDSSDDSGSSDPFVSNNNAAFPVTPATPTSFQDNTVTDRRTSLDSLRGMLAQSSIPSDPLIAGGGDGERFDGALTTRYGRSSHVEPIREFAYPTEYEPPELPNSLSWAKTTPPPIAGGTRSGDDSFKSGDIDGIPGAKPGPTEGIKHGGLAYRDGTERDPVAPHKVVTGPAASETRMTTSTAPSAVFLPATPMVSGGVTMGLGGPGAGGPPSGSGMTTTGSGLGMAGSNGRWSEIPGDNGDGVVVTDASGSFGIAANGNSASITPGGDKTGAANGFAARPEAGPPPPPVEKPAMDLFTNTGGDARGDERPPPPPPSAPDRPESGIQFADEAKTTHYFAYKPNRGTGAVKGLEGPGSSSARATESSSRQIAGDYSTSTPPSTLEPEPEREETRTITSSVSGATTTLGGLARTDYAYSRGLDKNQEALQEFRKEVGQAEILLEDKKARLDNADKRSNLAPRALREEQLQLAQMHKLEERAEKYESGGTAAGESRRMKEAEGKPGWMLEGNEKTDVPDLGDLPILGRLFNERDRDHEDFYATPEDAPAVEFKTELPKPMFVGTPVAVKLPNLESLRRQPAKPFLVPKGVTNVAKGKKVTASDNSPVIGGLGMVTDGDKDGKDGSYVELGPDKQWVQIDLEKPTDIHGLRLWHYHQQARAYNDVVVEASNDPDFKQSKVVVFNNDHDNTMGFGKGTDKAYIETNEGRLIDARKDSRPLRARYVRIHSRGNTSNEMNHYTEVEVYGKPAGAGAAKPEPEPQTQPKPAVIEKQASAEPFSTFSLHVSNVSFKLAMDALAKNQWPAREKIRTEEFVNAFDYGDPLPTRAEKVACAIEQAAHPFMQQRNLLRISMRTAAVGRSSGTPLRLTLVLDRSGSMERADRAASVRRAFAILASMLQPQDKATLIGFARSPQLLADQVPGNQSGRLVQIVSGLPSEGGTNIEAALKLATEKAREQFQANAQNRIILFTDGAANLGDAEPESLSILVENMRGQGIAFDAGGFGIEGLNDEVLEALTRKGDGRYYVLDKPEDADEGFARQVAGALRPAARNVKVQVEFNPERVGAYKLFGFEKHRLKKEDFRNDKVDAAEMAAAEAGVAVYQVETKPEGAGDIGSVSVRFQDTSTGQMVEKRWAIPYCASVPPVEHAAPSIRVAAAATFLAETLKGTPAGSRVELNELPQWLAGLSQSFAADARVQSLTSMIETTRNLANR